MAQQRICVMQRNTSTPGNMPIRLPTVFMQSNPWHALSTRKSNNTLGPALDSLEKAGVLRHPALKQAFDKLYGYTNTEQGIRHALLDKNAADVGLDEAIFMFGACASFSAYLAEKYRKAGGA